MSEALNELIAQRVMGLVEGRDFGTFPDHDWNADEVNDYNQYMCRRCFESTPEWSAKNDDSDESLRRRFPGPCSEPAPDYSEAHARAWQVVEAMEARHGYRALISYCGRGQSGVRFRDIRLGENMWLSDDSDPQAISSTFPLAVCEAAAKALAGAP